MSLIFKVLNFLRVRYPLTLLIKKFNTVVGNDCEFPVGRLARRIDE